MGLPWQGPASRRSTRRSDGVTRRCRKIRICDLEKRLGVERVSSLLSDH